MWKKCVSFIWFLKHLLYRRRLLPATPTISSVFSLSPRPQSPPSRSNRLSPLWSPFFLSSSIYSSIPAFCPLHSLHPLFSFLFTDTTIHIHRLTQIGKLIHEETHTYTHTHTHTHRNSYTRTPTRSRNGRLVAKSRVHGMAACWWCALQKWPLSFCVVWSIH